MSTILVADDSETILLLMRTRLEMAGHTVATAAPGLLLLDAMMPRKSGIDALREIRGSGSEVPALIVSAHQNPGDADAPTDLAIDGYITKPIDFDRLLELIAELT